MIVLGLTGSVGMGKSTASKLFSDEGIPVYDADAAVHALYKGAAVPLIEAAFPGTTRDGEVDRAVLSRVVFGDPESLKKLEEIVHPLVREIETSFVEAARAAGAPLVVLDIPLLFENGGEQRCDLVAVVSAPPEIQRERVMRRGDMSEEKFEAILARQVPDAEKRARADIVIDTSGPIEDTRRMVKDIIARFTAPPAA
ncbi:dephospho-CoA kinase [Terrihabitans soli]|uniref:Dephospho-CoA kinase n=1 Tax=Terrihabitans soli TaxID=708113 RepID=A0A6S6QR01_9HYPH|nr:dephospho-CoA kinase [Terrihabitans soli]BCJ89320.1 dephospho-CoA kinase [Terrihabitans soli]